MLNIEKYWNKLTEMKVLNLKDFSLINGELVECNVSNCPYCEFKNKHHNCDAKTKKFCNLLKLKRKNSYYYYNKK